MFNISKINQSILSRLRHLTLDFRVQNRSSLSPWDDLWFRNAIGYLVTTSPCLETLDIFSSSLQKKLRLGLLKIFDLSLENLKLEEIRLSFVTFDEEQLRLFVDHFKSSLHNLTIQNPVFQHRIPWKDYVLSDSDGNRLVDSHQPTNDELINFWQDAWSQGDPPEHRNARADMIGSDETGEVLERIRESWFQCRHDETFHLEWPEGHVFAGAIGTYEGTASGLTTLTIEWPQNRPADGLPKCPSNWLARYRLP